MGKWLAVAWISAACVSACYGQAMTDDPLSTNGETKRAAPATGVSCDHYVAVCGGIYFGSFPNCSNGPDVYDLTVAAAVHIIASVRGADDIPLVVGIVDPSGAGNSNAFLVDFTTTTAGVHSVIVYPQGPGSYALSVTCSPSAACAAEPRVLCLRNNRFSVTTMWQTETGSGSGTAVRLTGDAGYFWFFDPANVEVVTKVLNACTDPFNRYWVFAGGLTNVAVGMTVLDTTTGLVNVYRNPAHSAFVPIQDTAVFATCP